MMSFIRFLILLFFILGAISIGFISFIKADNVALVINSPLQGSKVLLPGKWGIYPERIIPGYVDVAPLTSSIELEGEVSTSLPYHSLLKNIQNYTIVISYTLDKALNPKEQEDFVRKRGTLINHWKAQIEGVILEKTNDMLESHSAFDRNKLKANILKELEPFQTLDIHFSSLPNMEEYVELRSQIEKTLTKEQVGARESLLEIEDAQRQKQIAFNKAIIQNALEFSIDKAKALDKAKVDTQTTFSILSLLLNGENPSPNLLSTPRKTDKEKNS